MKITTLGILILSLLFCSSRLNAQSSELGPLSSQKPPSAIDELEINVTDSTLSASFKNKTVPVSNFQELNHYLKNSLESGLHKKALITRKGQVDPERYRTLLLILGKYKIQSVRSFNEF